METIRFRVDLPAARVVSEASIKIELGGAPKRFYRHGWQSWSLAAWTDVTRVMPVQKPYLLHPMQHDPAYAFHPRPHGSWIGAAELQGGEIILLGSLGLDAHVELDGDRLVGSYESGVGDWFVAHGDEAAVFANYAGELGKRLGSRSTKAAPRVWCSWYGLYTAIDERLLLKVFDGLGDLPFDVLQVDDGWQVAVGDWEANSKFPAGMPALAAGIKSTGRKAGLWLAPLIAVKSSHLFRAHPDWFLRDDRGKFASAGFNWGEQLYALDTTQPAALKWLAGLMKQVRAWGFDYLKLDFLYAGALPGRRHIDIAREAAYRHGLEVLREAMGTDAYFVACGAPIIPSLGLCDALRIGPDVAAGWENHRDAVLLHNPTIPGSRNAIRTTLHRLWLKPLVQLDPDVAYFRSVECALTSEQKSLLQNLALICGFRATSDLPQWLSGAERAQLREFLQATPQIERLGPGTFRVDGQEVDFGSALGLPESPTGRTALVSGLIGWLANHALAMQYKYWSEQASIRRLTKDLRE